jgi:phosphoglycerol transferase
VPHAYLAALYAPDRDFIAQVEGLLPRGAMVFQLPCCGFPEGGGNNLIGAYDHLRPYLHSHAIHWSFGAYKGREASLWQRGVAALPTPDMVRTLAQAGFAGIYVDRTGYPDRAAALETQLAQILGARPLTRADNRWLFFPMAEYNGRLRAGKGRFAEPLGSANRPLNFLAISASPSRPSAARTPARH